jgi:hypothetical protein
MRKPIQLATLWLVAALATLANADAQSFAAADQSSSIPLLPPAAMSESDARIAVAEQPAVAESARLYGYVLDSSYDYREIACPFAPGHLLLAYKAVQSGGAVSRFTAVLRRGAEGEIGGRQGGVEIIPILHFGVVPFVPAYSSPHSFEVFNQAVTAGPEGREAVASLKAGREPLLTRSLCFLAMIGEPPAAIRAPSLDPATLHAPVPTLQFVEKARVRQILAVRNSEATYQVWTLTFSPAGRLLAAQPEEHSIRTEAPTLTATAPSAPPPPAPTPSSPEPIPPPAPASSATAIAPAVESPESVPVSRSATEKASPVAAAAPPRPLPSVRPSPLHRSAPNAALAPPPPSRFIPDPPPPTGRIIPDAALQAPPHAP